MVSINLFSVFVFVYQTIVVVQLKEGFKHKSCVLLVADKNSRRTVFRNSYCFSAISKQTVRKCFFFVATHGGPALEQAWDY